MLITQTPLRISLAGGGTDLAAYYTQRNGAVLSGAIDKYIYVILNKRFDDKIYISYSRKEIVDSVDEIRHELVREALRKAGIQHGIEIAMMADIPSEGCGLGSSSSLTVGLLNAFYTYQGHQVSAEQLAREACEIEIGICGKPIGKQDQYIAAYGGVRFIEFKGDESVTVEHAGSAELNRMLGHELHLFFTNITRSADPILKQQTQQTPLRMSELDGIRALADRARSSLAEGSTLTIGELLRENWLLKKSLAAGITTPEIDEMVSKAHSGGATGSKVCGAGGGGFLLVHCPIDRKESLMKAMANYREMPFFFERCGSKVIFNVESYEWN